MKCNKCGYDYSDSGDSAHMCNISSTDNKVIKGVDGNIFTREEVKIGRLEKRIAKLTKQRDFYKARCNNYKEVLDLHPNSVIRYASYTDRVLEHKHKKDLERRVEEQALLIQELRKLL